MRAAVRSGAQCLILNRHAALTWGSTLPEAVCRFDVFERAAETELLGRALNRGLQPRPVCPPVAPAATMPLSADSAKWEARAVTQGLLRAHEGFWVEPPFPVGNRLQSSAVAQALKSAWATHPEMKVAALVDPPILAALDLCGRAPNGALLTEGFFFLRDIRVSCPPSDAYPVSWWPGHGLLAIAETCELLYHRVEVAVTSARSQWAAGFLESVSGLDDTMKRNMNQAFFVR